jgi:hypothetical protein
MDGCNHGEIDIVCMRDDHKLRETLQPRGTVLGKILMGGCMEANSFVGLMYMYK